MRLLRPQLAAPTILLGSFLVLIYCARPDGLRTGQAFLDSSYEPEILFEGRPIDLPAATGGNRFLTGWRPWREGGKDLLMALESGGRLEVVQLSDRPRTLVLDLSASSTSAKGRLLVRAAGHELGTTPLSDRLEIALPLDLPLGRVPIDLIPQDGAQLLVLGASMRTALPRGNVHIENHIVRQSGESLISFVRRFDAGEVLTGVFQPPASPRPGQEFQVRIQRGNRPVVTFKWKTSFLNRARGNVALDIPVSQHAGLVRVSFVAHGEGPAASWKDLQLHNSGSATSAVDRSIPSPPTGIDPSRPPKVVILYVLDALRADRVSHLNGKANTTPTIDRLASAGLTFLAHRSVAPNTLPSTKALMTGIAPIRHGGSALPPGPSETVAERFRQAGYSTGLFSNNPYVSRVYGIDRGFDYVEKQSSGQASSGYYDDASPIQAAALEWLRSLGHDQQAFLYLHTLHPHNPYNPPPPFDSRFTQGIDSRMDGSTKTLLNIQRRRLTVTEADQRRLAALYDGNIAFNDSAISDFLGELESIYRRDEILLAITSDHGEELFDHGGVLHGYTLYEEMIRIPLVLWSPGRVRVGTCLAQTSTLDLQDFLLQLAGASETPGVGCSLREGISKPSSGPREEVHFAAAASVKGGIFSVQNTRWKLIWAPRTPKHWGMGEALGRSYDGEYFFDLENDPREVRNLAGLVGLEESELRSRLLAWIKARDGSSHIDPTIDEETRNRLEALGYLE